MVVIDNNNGESCEFNNCDNNNIDDENDNNDINDDIVVDVYS